MMAQANPPPPYGFSADNNQAQMPMPSAPEDNAKSVNAMISQQDDDDYVRITLRIPGLKVKRQINFNKVPKNMKFSQLEYKKNFVNLRVVVNEGLNDATIYKYANSEAFLGPIEENKSHFKYDENVLHWYVKKAHKW